MNNAMPTKPQLPNVRNKLYQLLAVGKKQLGWSEDFYRSILQQHGATLLDGKYSAKTLSFEKLEDVLAAMKREGFVVQANKQPTAKDKVLAKWAELAEREIVRSGTMESLEAFIKRQTGIEKFQFLHTKEHIKAVLTAMDNMNR